MNFGIVFDAIEKVWEKGRVVFSSIYQEKITNRDKANTLKNCGTQSVP